MLFRLLLLLAIAGVLTVFTLQNLTPLLPLVFFGIKFPALPLSWWVLGAIGAGVLSMLAIQVLFGLSNFVTGQTVRSRVRADSRSTQSRWSASTSDSDPINRTARTASSRTRTSPSDDSTWQDWRGYEAPQPQTAPRSTPNPIDDWERPPSDEWESPASSQASQDRTRDRGQPEDLKNFETTRSPRQETRSGSAYSYSYREPQDAGGSQPAPKDGKETVVDADYRVIVPPYRPLDEPTIPIPPPPPPPVEENADDWFEDSSGDEFGEKKSNE